MHLTSHAPPRASLRPSLAVALAIAISGVGGLAPAALAQDASPAASASTASGFFDSSYVHSISITVDPDDYAAAIAAYQADETKEWLTVTAVIDGVTYEDVGMRLKGNSSLRSLSGNDGFPGGGFPGGQQGDGTTGTPPAVPDGAPSVPGSDSSTDATAAPAATAEPATTAAPAESAEPAQSSGATTSDLPAAETLPWLLRLDKNVDDQSIDGVTDIVVRSNSTQTALNEAVALELLSAAGLASQEASSSSFSVNGSDPVLRLVIEDPEDHWMAEHFEDAGALYKAESTGDWSYRGDDPESYDEVFDQEAGDDVTDMTPLIEFLQWVNESDQATFSAGLAERFDVDAFATYLAMMDLLDNFDDIDGPGNNAYLYWDATTATFTIVPWDMNLAFGTGMGGGGFGDGQGPRGDGGQFPGGPSGSFDPRPCPTAARVVAASATVARVA
ncbi:MAG: CotH kinase family protein [Chloroflexota bacterium]